MLHVGANFEMRTVLSLRNTLINCLCDSAREGLYTESNEWGESRIAERQRKREGERQSIAKNERCRKQ